MELTPEMQELLKKFEPGDLELQMSSVVKPSWDWPSSLKCPPWRIEAKVHPQWKSINKILQASLDFQRSTCPPFMPEYISADHSLQTACHMRFYLKTYLESIGDKNSTLEFQFGYLDFPERDASLPHAWLELNGQIIQTAFTLMYDRVDPSYKAPKPKDQIKTLMLFNKTKRFIKYTDELKPLIAYDLSVTTHPDSLTLKMLKTVFDTKDGDEKYSVINCVMPCREGLWNALMTRYLREEFNLEVPDLIEKWSGQCWTCGKKSSSLKTCSICQCARYCGRECQIKGRPLDKILDKFREKGRKFDEFLLKHGMMFMDKEALFMGQRS